MRKSYLLLLLLSVLTVFSGGLTSCGSSDNGETEYIPVQLTQGGAWTFIDSKGERVGTQEWEFQPTVTYSGIFTARTDSGITVYSWEGTTAIPIDSLRNLASAGVLNEGLMPVTPAMQRIRIVDKKGKTQFVLNPIGGKEVTSCAANYSDGLLIINTVDGKSGAVDKKGNIVVEPKYSEISNFVDGYALARNNDFENFEKGPEYFIIDKEGKATPVKGKFGYCEEGECSMLSEFVNGKVRICGQPDSVVYYKPLELDVTGKVTKADENIYTQYLPDGASITNYYDSDTTKAVWKGADGKVILKIRGNKEMSYIPGYVMITSDPAGVNGGRSFTVFNMDGTQLGKVTGFETLSSPGGKFGLFGGNVDENYELTWQPLDSELKPIAGITYYGIGTEKFLFPENEDEIICDNYVTSAYVDITAAATKLVQMATQGMVKGKENYYVGQTVTDVFKGENANFYRYQDYTLTIPTDDMGRLATGAGFWVDGSATANAKIVAPTYEHYFQVDHYDYWGTAWGWNRVRQVGVHFNPSAKIESFDLQLHTNHPSGEALRESIARRLKKEGYTTLNHTENYDEYSNGSSTIIIYGAPTSKGVGAFFGKTAASLSESRKQSLAATLY